MKKGLMMLILMLAVGMAYGQMRTELKGPKAKNYKPWKVSKSNSVVASLDVESVKGPEAKNARVWDSPTEVNSSSAIASSNRLSVKGPKAKNQKLWKSGARSQREYLVKKNEYTEQMAKD